MSCLVRLFPVRLRRQVDGRSGAGRAFKGAVIPVSGAIASGLFKARREQAPKLQGQHCPLRRQA
ncbi:hypothetical protein SAMN04487976_1308 [Xaviernesmea oryzae]|nr:hypothetical protein SAMN04487976_1308 [Xaviernesmea oryzae]